MVTHGSGLSPGSKLPRSDDRARQIDEIIEFWNDLRTSEQLGATTWSVLEPLERTVADAFSSRPENLTKAIEATAEAFAHIAGFTDL
jgi:hypothetical protein